MERNSFEADKIFEQNVFEYLRYSHFGYQLDIKEIVKDRERQLQGIDYIKCDGTKVDVKSVASIKLTTFCFELKNTSSGKSGGFVNPKVKTDAYLLTYHEVSDPRCDGTYGNDKQYLTPDNITQTRMIYITKKKVQQLLKDECKFTHRIDTSLNMISSGVEKRVKNPNQTKRYAIVPYTKQKLVDITDDKAAARKYADKIKVVYTGNHNEHPINIVIPRKLLEKYADKVGRF